MIPNLFYGTYATCDITMRHSFSIVSRAVVGGKVNMVCARKTHSTHPRALGLLIMGAEHIPPNELNCDHIDGCKQHLLALGVESCDTVDLLALEGVSTDKQEYFVAGDTSSSYDIIIRRPSALTLPFIFVYVLW